VTLKGKKSMKKSSRDQYEHRNFEIIPYLGRIVVDTGLDPMVVLEIVAGVERDSGVSPETFVVISNNYSTINSKTHAKIHEFTKE
jgi:hypothetical protein